MIWSFHACDILELPADVLVCSANVSLNLSGGIGGALLAKYGYAVQKELHEYLHVNSLKYAQRGDVILTAVPNTPYKAILHCVAVDGFYQTSPEIIRKITFKALEKACELEARTVAMGVLGTGFGNLTLEGFADGIRPIVYQCPLPIGEVFFCMEEPERVRELYDAIFEVPSP